jgi:hypothetical protein
VVSFSAQGLYNLRACQNTCRDGKVKRLWRSTFLDR